MNYSYYIQTELVFEYIDNNGKSSLTRTDRKLEKKYLQNISNEDLEQNNYNEKLEKIINKPIRKKILYENEVWRNESYEKRYLKILKIICPRMIKLLKIYKSYTACETNYNIIC